MVKEFLEKPEIWSRLLELTKGIGFDASVSLLRSGIIMLIISVKRPRSHGIPQPVEVGSTPTWNRKYCVGICELMSLAVQAEQSSGCP